MTTDTTSPTPAPATLSAEELDAIRARHAKTTPGDWFRRCNYVITHPDSYMVVAASNDGTWLKEDENLDFIGHAHQDVPRLLATVDALTARAAQAEADRDKAIALLTDLRADLAAAKDKLQVTEAAFYAASAAAEAREAVLLTLLANAARFVRHLAESETDGEIYASATQCEADIDAALQGAQPAQGGEPTMGQIIDAIRKAGGVPEVVKPLVFAYTNHRGETGTRRAVPLRVYHGSTEWHPEPQWLMEAMDLDKGAIRAFAMKDMGPEQGGDIARLLDAAGRVVRETEQDADGRFIVPEDAIGDLLDCLPEEDGAGLITEGGNG